MSELPIIPFPAPAGLESLGSADAGVCVDGVCSVPQEGGLDDRVDAGPATEPQTAR